ncbi:MAG: Na/Pi symporter [Thermoguttaceae bacterium]|nr:Na/Pi symporter [Thermoguttaceae bacterium]
MTPSQNDAFYQKVGLIARLALFVFLVYLFLVAVKMFGTGVTTYTNYDSSILNTLASQLKNPFTGLCLGIILTALMQSSSATTSISVAMVATGAIPLEGAIPIAMGANIGAALPCTIVSLTHIGGARRTFTRAFSASLILDTFNILTVLICFTLEMSFGYLTKTATFLASLVPVSAAGNTPGFNPISYAVDTPAKGIQNLCLLGLSPLTTLIIMGTCGLIIMIFSLVYITKNMKSLMADKIEDWLNRALSKNGYIGLLVGVIVTMLIQSSGITTSLLVPLVAVGVLSVKKIYPIVIGAKVGTTITAILAATAFLNTPNGQMGLALAFAHTLFNITGVILFYPIPQMRFPIFLSRRLSIILARRRRYVVGWIAMLYFILPALGFLLFRNFN